MFDKHFFVEHQRAILQALNNPLVGWVMRRMLWIPDKHPILKVTPDSYHVLLPDGKVKATIYATNQYAQALHKNAKLLWESLHWWDMTFANRFVPAWNVGFDTYTSQPDGTAGMDTYIVSSEPTNNKGAIAELYSGELSGGSGVYRTLIKFDFSSIPASAATESGTLSLWQASDFANNARTHRFYRQKRDWVESQATWNIWKTSNNWSTAGGFHADDCEQTEIASRSMTATETNAEKQWTNFSTTLLNEMINGTFTNNGFLLKADTESDDLYQYKPSDFATAGERPKMVIVYSLSAGNFFPFF